MRSWLFRLHTFILLDQHQDKRTAQSSLHASKWSLAAAWSIWRPYTKSASFWNFSSHQIVGYLKMDVSSSYLPPIKLINWDDLCISFPSFQVGNMLELPVWVSVGGEIHQGVMCGQTSAIHPPMREEANPGCRKERCPTLQLSNQFFAYSSWWFQPIWKILVKLDHFPR